MLLLMLLLLMMMMAIINNIINNIIIQYHTINPNQRVEHLKVWEKMYCGFMMQFWEECRREKGWRKYISMLKGRLKAPMEICLKRQPSWGMK